MKIRRYTKTDIVKITHDRIHSRQKQIDLLRKNINKIKNNINTIQVKYPEYKECFEYVDNFFPLANVKEVILYKASSRLMEKLGFGCAGGFYDRISKIIVFSSSRSKSSQRNKYIVQAKLNKDEVIVHELLHYAYFEEGKYSVSNNLNEEFAYGWSIGYLRKKNYSDDDIIKHNFLPFLYSSIKEKVTFNILAKNGIRKKDFASYSVGKRRLTLKKHYRQIHKEILSLAKERGLKLLSIYSKKLNGEKEEGERQEKKTTGFNFLDLD